jgi:hypothetical protein
MIAWPNQSDQIRLDLDTQNVARRGAHRDSAQGQRQLEKFRSPPAACRRDSESASVQGSPIRGWITTAYRRSGFSTHWRLRLACPRHVCGIKQGFHPRNSHRTKVNTANAVSEGSRCRTRALCIQDIPNAVPSVIASLSSHCASATSQRQVDHL